MVNKDEYILRYIYLYAWGEACILWSLCVCVCASDIFEFFLNKMMRENRLQSKM